MSRNAHQAGFATQLRLYGESVTYTPSGGTAKSLTALRGMTTFREGPNQNNGGRVIRSTDWLFDPSEVRDQIGRWPNDGDQITAAPQTEVAGLNSQTFRVTPVNNEPVYRFDPTYTRLRVHTLTYSES